MFGKKDGIKEFEQMRQALKPAERFATRGDEENSATSRDGAVNAGATGQPSGSVSPAHSAAQGEDMKTADNCSTVLSSGTAWQGSLKTQGSVRVEGQLSGEIDATDTVFVAEGAQVDAKIRAAFVVLAGQLKGEVNCGERLEIMPTGQVRAELTTKSLVVHEGAFIEGQIHMTEDKSTVAHLPGALGSRPGQPVPKAPDKDGKITPLSPATV
ncbi:MAG TPA: polymer-forming cytoskeletal protein [Chloroflexota bacterium]|nr:polymer-forming cytoskeletal protein [Chloroflexota bacterium]